MFGYIVDLTGGLTGSMVSFILPALVYLGATAGFPRYERGFRWQSRALIGFGVVVMIVVPIGVIMDIVKVSR